MPGDPLAGHDDIPAVGAILEDIGEPRLGLVILDSVLDDRRGNPNFWILIDRNVGDGITAHFRHGVGRYVSSASGMGSVQVGVLRHRAGLDAPLLGALEDPCHHVEVSLDLCLRLGIRRSAGEKLHIVEHHHQRAVHSIDRRLVQDVIQDSAKRVLIGVPGAEPDGFGWVFGEDRPRCEHGDGQFQDSSLAGSGNVPVGTQRIGNLREIAIVWAFLTCTACPADMRSHR